MASVQKRNATKYLNLSDYERLETHVESEGDLLIKNLAVKQADKHLTLEKYNLPFMFTIMYLPLTHCL